MAFDCAVGSLSCNSSTPSWRALTSNSSTGHVTDLLLQVLQQIEDRGSDAAQLPDRASSSVGMLLLLLLPLLLPLAAPLPAAAAEAAKVAHNPGRLRCWRLVIILQQAAARR
jgi:hypothetical protein